MSTAPCTRVELPAVDPEALARLERFGGAKLLREMIDLYVDNATGRLGATQAAVAAGDAAAAENALHSLKSSSAQLGALGLSRLCEQGEGITRGGSLLGVPELLEAARRELERVERWLADQRAARGA